MAARALLIGSEIAGLSGVTRDLDIVGDLLAARAFEVRRHEHDTATRDAIIRALRDLATDTGPGDPVVVYYAGHGGWVRDTAVDPTREPATLQYIAPYDYEQSTADDFRGLTALELSVHLQAISARTDNLSVILDCCFSSRMARDVHLVPRAIPRISYADVGAHLARVGVDQLACGLNPQVEGNPEVVRLVAAGPTEQAFEYRSPLGQVGLLTEGLRRLLADADAAPLTWAALVRSLRSWVQVLAPNQRPEAEGAADRLLFRTECVDASDVVPVTPAPGGATLGAGRLAGVGVGDIYLVLDDRHPDLARPLAQLTVDAVTATSAHAALLLADGVPALPSGAQARPVSRAARRQLVIVAGAGFAADAVTAAVAASPYLAPIASPDAPDPAEPPPLATVTVTPDGMALADVGGPLTPSVPVRDEEIATTVRNLERLARAAHLRALDTGDPALAAALALTWGYVVEDAEVRLPESGAVVFPGDRVWVRLRNTGPTPFWVFVIGVGGAGDVVLLTNADPSGLRLAPGAEWVVGRRTELGRTSGLPATWPRVPAESGPRPESLVVIVTADRQDLSMLTQEGVRTRGQETPLQAMLGQIGDGRACATARDPAPSQDRYAIRHVEYLIVPTARPQPDRCPFVLDERPDVSLALLAPRGAAPASGKVAVWLAHFAVRRDGPPDPDGHRLDALVVTRGPGAAPVSRATTWRFPPACDSGGAFFGARDLLLSRGPVRDYLDVAVWLSSGRAAALDLESLLDNPVRPPVAGPAALAAAAGSLTAVGTVVEHADRALAAAVGGAVGVYRASFLAREAFGLGVHPVGGLPRAAAREPEMAFRLRIDEG